MHVNIPPVFIFPPIVVHVMDHHDYEYWSLEYAGDSVFPHVHFGKCALKVGPLEFPSHACECVDIGELHESRKYISNCYLEE